VWFTFEDPDGNRAQAQVDPLTGEVTVIMFRDFLRPLRKDRPADVVDEKEPVWQSEVDLILNREEIKVSSGIERLSSRPMSQEEVLESNRLGR